MKTYKKAIIVIAAMVATSMVSVEAGYLFGNIFHDFSQETFVAKKGGNSGGNKASSGSHAGVNSTANNSAKSLTKSTNHWTNKNKDEKFIKEDKKEIIAQVIEDDDDDDELKNETENNEIYEEMDYDTDENELSEQDKASYRINQALRKIEKAEEKISDKAEEGKDTSKAEQELNNAKALLKQAREALNNGDFDGAQGIAKEAKHNAALAKSKHILSLSERAKVARAFGKCISAAAQAKNFEAFAQCHAEFKGDIEQQIADELSEEDILANEEIDAKIDDLLTLTIDQELIDILYGFKEYNFSGVDSAEVIAKLDEIFNSEMTSEEKIEALTELLNELKEQSAEDKYEDEIIPFTDTDDEDWYFAYADLLKEQNCIEGYVNEDGTLTGEFGPGDPVLFGDSLKFVLSCMLDEEITETPEPTFWAVGWALTLVNEYSEYLDQNFLTKIEEAIDSPENFTTGLTRANIIAFLLDILEVEVPEAGEAPFTDVPLNHPYVDQIAYALELGIISGDEATGEFRPNAVPNRAEMVKILIMTKELLNDDSEQEGPIEETPATEEPLVSII